MRIFHIGATGYIGGAAARALMAAGHEVHGLARSDAAAAELTSLGAYAVAGDLAAPGPLADAARASEAVVYTAAAHGPPGSGLERTALAALVEALAGTDRPLVVLGGSLVYGDTGDEIAGEDRPAAPLPGLRGRAELDRTLLAAAERGVRTAVVHAPLVYGRGGGAIPETLVGAARARGAAGYVGDGHNAWATVHVDDLGDLLALVVAGAEAGTRWNAAGPIHTLRDIAGGVHRALSLPGEPRALTPEEAQADWGFFALPLSISQRLSGERARTRLGWTPRRPGFLDELRSGAYAARDAVPG